MKQLNLWRKKKVLWEKAIAAEVSANQLIQDFEEKGVDVYNNPQDCGFKVYELKVLLTWKLEKAPKSTLKRMNYLPCGSRCQQNGMMQTKKGS